jgi:predicted TPR repeat methyltransferase
MTDKFLKKTYGLSKAKDVLAHYNAWAGSYDAEVRDNGYATPSRIAAALWKQYPDPFLNILDFGCGTGLSGLALRAAGFETIDGTDPSTEMLAQAQAKNAYRTLRPMNIEQPLTKGAYPAIVGCGVLSTGAAPPETFAVIMNALPRGGLFVFSLNDHALSEPGYTRAINEWLDCGAARLLFKEYGEHLPGANLKSEVYVIEKL